MTQENSLTRREREKFNHRRQILDTALELFSEFGYHNVSMHRIAQKADFAVGTMYKFFPNKEELFRAMIVESAERANALFINALEIPGDEVEKIRNYVRVKGEVLMEDEAVLKLYIGMTHGADMDLTACLNEDIRQLYEKVLMKLADIFASGIKAGRFKPLLAPYYLAVSITSLTSAFLLLWLRDPERHPYLENGTTIVDIFLDIIKNKESAHPV